MNIKLGEKLLLSTFSISMIFKKLYLVKCAQFVLAHNYFCLQNIKISSEYADFYAKISLILDNAAHTYQIRKTTFTSNITLTIISVQQYKISLGYADFYAKISLILDTAGRNSITQHTLLINLSLNRKRYMLCWS